MQIKFSQKMPKNTSSLVTICSETIKGKVSFRGIDAKLNELLTNKIKNVHHNSFMLLTMPNKEVEWQKILVANLGKNHNSALQYSEFGALMHQELKKFDFQNDVAICFPEKLPNSDELVANIAFGALLNAYTFTKYKSKKDKNKELMLTFLAPNPAKIEKLFNELKTVAEGIYLARNLVLEPSNILQPENYAKLVSSEFKNTAVTVKILHQEELQKLGMNALLAVGQASKHPSRLVVLEYNGNKNKKQQPLAIVGKGITFDSGGISLKPPSGMAEMKKDMAGSAAVVGLFKTLSLRKAKVHAVGIIPLAENMPAGDALKPGDIIVSASKKTIEILNTDAEGRVILADAVWYAEKFYQPQAMIDLATLTGNVVMCLGSEYAGLFSDDEKLIKQLVEAGNISGEKLWRLPLNKAYDKMMDSDIADVANISGSSEAGSITGAHFIKRFVEKTPYAHIDIAGTAWLKKDRPMYPKSATGFGVRLLDTLVSKFYEN